MARNPQLKAIKAVKIEALKQQRDAIIFSPVNGVQVDSSRSREDVQGTVDNWALLGNPTTILWTMADNSEQVLSKADLQAVIDGYALRKMQTFAMYQQLKQAVNNAEKPEDVEAINYV